MEIPSEKPWRAAFVATMGADRIGSDGNTIPGGLLIRLLDAVVADAEKRGEQRFLDLVELAAIYEDGLGEIREMAYRRQAWGSFERLVDRAFSRTTEIRKRYFDLSTPTVGRAPSARSWLIKKAPERRSTKVADDEPPVAKQG